MTPAADAEPYINEARGEVYFRCIDASLNEARRLAASHARMEMGDSCGRARYDGRHDVPLHDHDDWEDCHECPAVPVWAFTTYERGTL